MSKNEHVFAPQKIGMKIYIFLVEKQGKFRPFLLKKIAVALRFENATRITISMQVTFK